ncbi:GAF domain-containing protein [Paenarthrobacter sp. YJN-5]|uniref:GAF domain-containing protein n=1 Tax=unclassified Paenarthrobacter TaxID=2634190 RepID=UPI0018786DF0|nr:GAF domain-containing protein [Paenarthrobacter sp. YJN-5]QOT19964.1 GAF domain-containing protein [Paenarthrobacter sp. YJN-5]
MSSQFESFDDVRLTAQTQIGATLFTASAVSRDGNSMVRVYTTHPHEYPVGGTKTLVGDMSPIWEKTVLAGQQPFLGADKEAVRACFSDSALIESLGCGSIVNVPVVSNGQTVGSMNFLAPEGSYDEKSVETALDIARRSVSLFEALTNAI